MSDKKQEFRELINKVKDDTGLTQDAIAKAMRMHRSTLSELLGDEKENGRGKVEQKHIDAIKSTTFPTKQNVVKTQDQSISNEIINHLLKSNDRLQDMHERLIHTHEDVVYSHKKLVDHFVPNSEPAPLPEQESLKKLWALVYKYLVKPGQKSEAEIVQELGSIEISAGMEVPVIGKN